jgi:hypothetical protein
MTENKIIENQVQEHEEAKKQTERAPDFAHSLVAGPHSSRGNELLDKIARDSVLNYQRAAKAVAGYRTTPCGETSGDDPLVTYVHGVLARAQTGKPPGHTLLGACRRRADDLTLNMNQLIQDLARPLRRMVKKKVNVQTVLAAQDTQIVADRKEMGRVLARTVAHGSQVIKKGGTITILARFLPIKSGIDERDGNGCALLSLSSTDVAVPGPQSDSSLDGSRRKSIRRAFSAVRSIIKGCNGSIRIFRQKDKVQLNIYLPVLRGT